MIEYGSLTYVPEEQARTTVAQFLQYLFGEVDVIPDDLRWTDSPESKLLIKSSYPLKEKRYPLIAVYSVVAESHPLFLGEGRQEYDVVSGFSEPTEIEDYETGEVSLLSGTVSGISQVVSIHTNLDVEVRCYDYNRYGAERIASWVLLFMKDASLRDLFTEKYGSFFDPSNAIRSSVPLVSPLPGGPDNEYSFSVTFRLFWQGEIVKKIKRADIIASETVHVTIHV